MTTTQAITAPLPLPRRTGRALLSALAVIVLVTVAAATFAIGRATAPASGAPTLSPVSRTQPTPAVIQPSKLSPAEIAHCHPAAC